jgi:hypothetical protein
MAGSFSLWPFAVSMMASALGGMLGMTSGIFILPVLTIFGHIDIHTAVGASLVSVIDCSCGGGRPPIVGSSSGTRNPRRLRVSGGLSTNIRSQPNSIPHGQPSPLALTPHEGRKTLYSSTLAVSAFSCFFSGANYLI